MPGLDPAWSRTVAVVDEDGVRRTWHVLDNKVAPAEGTLLCVHGNPTWSYLWRRFLASAEPGWRRRGGRPARDGLLRAAQAARAHWLSGSTTWTQ